VPIGAALLDQSVICGIGNVYRAEILFRLGINPHIESRDVRGSDVERIWNESVAQLRRGEKSGRIVTTDPADVGRRRRSDIARGERTYVYKRSGQPCRRCETPIERADMKGRKIWWCPSCQAA
jgi:formamidopyrimidine-DNA glycosylase